MSSRKHDCTCWKVSAWQKAVSNIRAELMTGPSFSGFGNTIHPPEEYPLMLKALRLKCWSSVLKEN